MSTITMDLSSNEAAVVRKASARSVLHLVLGISILLGPFAYLVCRSVSDSFASGGQGLALIAFCVIGFELVWLVYGLISPLRKLLHDA